MDITDLVRRFKSKIKQEAITLLSGMLPVKGRVFMMHSIGDDRHKLSISKEYFNEFIRKVKNKRILHLGEWDNKNDFICLTFDDVADSFYYNAFPVLKQYGIPFTIFVSCELLDKEKYITTEMLKEMSSNELCTVGSHGLHHSMFVEFSKEEAIRELSESKTYLETIVNKPVTLFAFPYGSYYACGFSGKKRVLDFYDYGFSTVSISVTKPLITGKYFLPRINVTESLIQQL